MYKRLLFTLCLILTSVAGSNIMAQRSIELLNEGWRFHFGNASDPQKDFGCGTEYFNYLTKANSIHNEGPYSLKFTETDWQDVQLPHDWAVDLPFAREASHSHGYKTVGYKYPETSVGWYRKIMHIGEEDLGKHIELQFDGIFRNAQVWFNGFFMGVEPSGYATHVYDITDYINYGGDNLICVRADASLEEGWFYEGAGIYRDAWLRKTSMAHVKTHGTFVYSTFEKGDLSKATLHIEAEVENSSLETVNYRLRHYVLDAEGNVVASHTPTSNRQLKAKESMTRNCGIELDAPHLWDINDPYMYTVRTEVVAGEQIVDTYVTPIGIRDVQFSAEKGFELNGRQVELKGVNCHQDHAGVGAAIPDALQEWRIKQLKQMGCNVYRASHNPMTPALLDVCDRMGMLVIDENRLMGINDYHKRQLENMIRRDRNHPSIILWSDGNEEWGLENTIQGVRVAASMREITHLLDPSRKTTIANAGGGKMIESHEIRGFNYIIQNDVENRHKQHPDWIVVGTEETTACGTRGIYYPDPEGRWMPAINRTDTTYNNIIERGWKFYDENAYAAGIIYWTGFDYRGEPNPLSYPATGSQFGLLDYCGFPKDEAYFLRSWWTDETILHIFPHWNLRGHEGEKVSVWAYSNCDEVELFVNGKSVGRKPMPKNSHLEWDAIYQPGKLRAVGYKKGKKVKETVVETTGAATQLALSTDRTQLKADGRDVAVMAICLKDKKGRVVPDACNEVTITVSGNARILGVGNGDSAFRGVERSTDLNCQKFTVPAFNGYAQVLVQTTTTAGTATVKVESAGLKAAINTIKSE